MAVREEAVYCTLLLSNNYLPGAMVLAHSLRDNGTKGKLVALFTPESLHAATINELKTVYDEIIPVHGITNGTPANLLLMDRPDLISTFTKIELWRQTQFKRIVYIDCDVVALRAPDELLSLETDFAAVPDVGWPDCFNSGVMVLRPNMQDYYSLLALAERGISFDGADQGLFNTHFKNWHRLSFTYNCTPSANYQYIPAYRHFQSTISLLHFIGSKKPWNLPRHASPRDSPYNQLLGRWWAIYDRHYRPQPPSYTPNKIQIPSERQTRRSQRPDSMETTISFRSISSALSQPVHASELLYQSPSMPIYMCPLEEKPIDRDVQFSMDSQTPEAIPSPAPPYVPEVEHEDQQVRSVEKQVGAEVFSAVPQYVLGEEHISTYIPVPRSLSQSPSKLPESNVQISVSQLLRDEPQQVHSPQPEAVLVPDKPSEKTRSPNPEKRPFSPPKVEWDASREPPPVNSKPEAMNLQKQTYTMSEDTNLFQPPKSYPEAPTNMYYEVPSTKPEPRKLAQLFPWESHAPKPTRVFLDDTTEHESIPRPRLSSVGIEDTGPTAESPLTASISQAPMDPWQTYSRTNAWDEVPEIKRYIQLIKQSRKGKVQVIPGTAGSASGGPVREPSTRLTDFPTELERPSLPVTPAPIRRPSFWDQEQDSTMELPAAKGVPNQEDWNPLARLEELRRRQSKLLERPNLLPERES